MTEQARELASWRRGKTPVISKYVTDHSKLFSGIAGRGFLSLPGYAYAIENDLELMTKMNLSELNYKILSETIEREMKQSGVDYGLAYKNAVIIWEISKQALLAAWDSELAGIKQDMAYSEEVLNVLAIEVSKRAVTLLEAKTALEEEMEAYKLELVNLDGTVSPYEVQLANAKLLTAQSKLLIIPILQEIITKEEALLVKEGLKVDAYTDYMAKEREVAAKKQTLSPVLNELAAKIGLYAGTIIGTQIPQERLIANEKVDQANVAVEKARYQVDEITTEIEIAGKDINLDTAKRDLEVTRFDDKLEIVSAEIDLNKTFQDKDTSQFDALLSNERQLQAEIIGYKESVHAKDSATKTTSVGTIESGTRDYNTGINAAEIAEIQGKAAARAAVTLTATLQHLVG